MSRVVVAGSCVVDLVFYTENLPSKGQTVLSNFERGLGGKGFNQAVAAKKAGADSVTFMGMIGEDSAGQEFITALDDYEIVDDLLVSKNKPTGRASITIDKYGNNSIAVALGANEDFSDSNLPSDTSILLAQLETNIPTLIALFKKAKQFGATTILNPAPMPAAVSEDFWELISLTDIVTPNETELEAITGVEGVENMEVPKIVSACKELLEKVPNIIITLGSRGSLHVGKVPTSGPAAGPGVAFKLFQPIQVEEVVDTSGAGDAFNGGLVAGLIHKEGNLPEAIKFANIVAGLSVTKKGTSASMPHLSEILRASKDG